VSLAVRGQRIAVVSSRYAIGPQVLWSTDGGAHFAPSTPSSNNGGNPEPVLGPDGDFIVARYRTMGGYGCGTYDRPLGGATWAYVGSFDRFEFGPDGSHIVFGFECDAAQYYGSDAVAPHTGGRPPDVRVPRAWRSGDGGQSFSPLALPGVPRALTFASATDVRAIVRDRVFASTDGGQTWTSGGPAPFQTPVAPTVPDPPDLTGLPTPDAGRAILAIDGTAHWAMVGSTLYRRE
jgi:hypothetical protein